MSASHYYGSLPCGWSSCSGSIDSYGIVPLKAATINREIEILRKMFTLAVDNGWLEDNPCISKKIKQLKEDNIIERYLQKDEEVRLLNACTGAYKYMKPIIICAVYSAMRKSEILNLKWECVDMKNSFITLLETKNGKKRIVPICPRLHRELVEIKKNQKSEYVFVNPETGKPYYDIKRPYEALLEKANIKNLRFHDLRHTAGTRFVDAGMGLPDVMKIMGHADLKITSKICSSCT